MNWCRLKGSLFGVMVGFGGAWFVRLATFEYPPCYFTSTGCSDYGFMTLVFSMPVLVLFVLLFLVVFAGAKCSSGEEGG